MVKQVALSICFFFSLRRDTCFESPLLELLLSMQSDSNSTHEICFFLVIESQNVQVLFMATGGRMAKEKKARAVGKLFLLKKQRSR